MKANIIGKKIAIFALSAMLLALFAGGVLLLSPRSALAGLVQIENTDYSITSDTSYRISPDVVERNLVMNTQSGTQTLGYVMDIDAERANLKFRASYGNLDPSQKTNWAFKSLSEQMKAYQAKYQDERVIAGVNSDIFNMTTGEPTGMLVIRGERFHENASRAFFASFSDGSVGIFEAGTTLDQALEQQKTKRNNQSITLEEASGGFFTLAMNGQLTSTATTDGSLVPRTAIGIKEDGSVVILCVDGRQAPRSSGLTTQEVAYTMLHLGCRDVLNFDGGGSTTFSTQREGEDSVEMRNIPSDGFERAISSALLITTTAQPSGTFDHVSLFPQNEYYTPGSSVELSALASDVYGFAVDTLPQGEWKVKGTNGEKGTFQNDSLNGNTAKTTFTAPQDYVGDVTVEYLVNGVSKGETTLGFYHPDALSFPSDSVNLDYREQTDFGLSAYRNQKIVHLKAGDITWSATKANESGEDTNENFDSSGCGTFQGLTFQVTEDWHVSEKFFAHAVYAPIAQNSPSAYIFVAIGMQPTVVINGGDEGEQEVADQDGQTHAIRYDSHFGRVGIEGGVIKSWDSGSAEEVDLVTAHYVESDGTVRGGNESAEVVSAESEEWLEKIRFGTKAIKLNYDFSGSGTSIEGACLGFSREQLLTGSPTAIGLWLYAPEGTANLWLRAAIGVQNVGSENEYSYQYVNFTEACNAAQAKDPNDFGGINWEGWKYVEASLAEFSGRYIKILPGELVRLMYATGTYQNGLYDRHGTSIPQQNCKGWVLIDNVQFVYGTNTQDVVAPVTGGIQYSYTGGSDPKPLTEGMQLEQNLITFRTSATDDTALSPYNTGMSDACYYYVDGKLFKENAFQTDGDYCYSLYLPDGVHSVRFYAKDNFGNVADETIYFTVNTDRNSPHLELVPDDFAGIGNIYRIKLYAFGDVKKADFTLLFNADYDIETICADNVSKTSEKDGVYRFTIGGALEEGLLATLKLKIPENLFAESRVSFSAQGSFESDQAITVPEGTEISKTFRMKTVYSDVEEFYHLRAQDMIVGMGDGTIFVFDTENDPADEIEVYYVDETKTGKEKFLKLGKTDRDGALIREDETQEDPSLLTKEQGTFTLYAVDENGARSFYTPVTSYNAVQYEGGEPAPVAYYAIFHAVSDPSTQKKISWMSYIKDRKEASKANKVELSESEDMKDSVNYTGTSSIVSYQTTKNANYVNQISLTSLKPGTTYYYRVGDGENWSQVSSFTTAGSLIKETNFFVIGDMQGEDAKMASKFSDNMAKSGKDYAFGLQTGDSIDNPGSYDEWTLLLEILSKDVYAKTPMIHVIGNHETVSDPTANAARKIFMSDAEKPSGWSSYEIGDVYVATLGFTTDAEELANFAAWLKEDAEKSTAAWKILSCHVPIYNTNPDQSESEIYRRAGLDKAIEEAGISFVFSGHDHSYARTKPLLGGEENEKGVVYFIVGTAGEKKYGCFGGANFKKRTQEYNALYLSVSANSRHIEITAWDVQEDGTASVFDSYEIGPKECQLANHDLEYDKATGDFFCKICGHYYKIEDLTLYSGLVADKESGHYRYLQGGKFLSGASNADGTWRYYDKDGLSLEGTISLGGETFKEDCTFEKGVFVPNDRVTNAGLAGEDAYFLILEGKTFYLTGSGKTYSFSSESGRPWGTIEEITAIVVGKDVTEIGDAALRNIPNVSSLTFEKDSKLTVIGADCLRELGRDVELKSVILPQSVKTIKPDAFRGIRVGTLSLPDGVEPFVREAFRWYFRLELNVLEGSVAEDTAKALELPYQTRRYLFCEEADDRFTGAVLVENVEKTRKETRLIYEGELAEDMQSNFEAISETLKRYHALSKEQQSDRAEDLALVKELIAAYNEDAEAQNQVQQEAGKNALDPLAAGAVAAAATALSAVLELALKRRFL